MKLYLSSFRFGDNPQQLRALFSDNKNVALIGNAIDFETEAVRKQKMQIEMDGLSDLGLNPLEHDLRSYFGKKDDLKEELSKYGGVWIRGGNVFILRRAMLESGFDELIRNKSADNDFIYSGYSAGVCVVGPTLHGYEIVDDPYAIPIGYKETIIWDGLNIIPYSISPHYQSDHPESALVDKEVEYRIEHNMPYKTLRDGEVIIEEVSG